MNTIDELLYYCRESEPVGALLLTGEWGCGKTYIIEHDLKEALKNEAIVIRASLFGISSSEEIHSVVKSAWIEAYCEMKGVDKAKNKFMNSKKKIAQLDFLPDWIKGIANTDLTSFITIRNKIDDKSVILVFDDLERCRMNSVDALGIINDYCENQKYHTIIVANQEKIIIKQTSPQITGELQFSPSQKGNVKPEESKVALVLNALPQSDLSSISYTEIKEKIIQRTVHYFPNYPKIVNAIIKEVKYDNIEYKNFVESCEEGLLELFAPDRNIFENDEDTENEKMTNRREGQFKRSHNIRSLKCAISDFRRVYETLRENDFTDIAEWFYSFTSYVIAYKADIAKEGDYGTLFNDEEVHQLYPAFQNQYMLNAVKQWILHGVWNENAISHEIEIVKKRKEALRPCEIIKVSRIMCVDEDILEEGFAEFLNNVYEGQLTLDDYVLFIKNSSWARQNKYDLPEEIDWHNVEIGVGKCIERLKTTLPDGQILYHIIDAGNQKYFTDEEWRIYKIISNFALGNSLMFFRNRQMYIEKMKDFASSSFVFVQNKRFDVFDEEMALVTAQAFYNENNYGKDIFVSSFSSMWQRNIHSQDIIVSESLNGFSKLKDLLQKQLNQFQENKKTFAAYHTKRFIKTVEEIMTEAPY